MSVVERAAAAVDAAHAAFADADVLARASQQEVVELLALTAELTRVADAQRVRLAGAVAERSRTSDDRSICRLLGARSAREAVGRAFGIRTRDAAALLSLAAASSAAVSITGDTIAAPFPRVAAALDAGALSLAQARAIVDTLAPAAARADLEQLAWAEGCLVDEARHPEHPLVPELLVTQAQAYVAVLDPDGVLPDSERQRALRSLRMRQLPDGSWLIVLRATAEGGAAVKAVVDACTAPGVQVRFTDAPDDGDEPPIDAARAPIDAARAPGDAPGSLGPAATTDADPAPASADTRSLAQKRHDALVAMAEAHAASGAAPVAGGEVPRLVLTGTVEAFDAYLRGVEHRDRALTIQHTGGIVPIETVDRLLCDGIVQRAVTDAGGHVLELGRTARLFTRAQRRALAAQYRGCATPGCGFPVDWTEAHHVVWWERGGSTDTANGILLCSHCHHEVHAGRLLVVGEPGDWRVVAQLRPADPYARSRRAPVPASSDGRSTAAAAAPPALAVRLAEPVEAVPLRRRRGRGGSGARAGGWRGVGAAPVETRLRQRLRRQRRAPSRARHEPRRRSTWCPARAPSSCARERAEVRAGSQRRQSARPVSAGRQLSFVISTLTNSWLLPAPA